MGFFDDMNPFKKKDKNSKSSLPDPMGIFIQNQKPIESAKKAGNLSSLDILGLGFSKETEGELLGQLKGRKGQKRTRKTLDQLALGDKTKLGRRENLRFRTEIQRDQPGRKGLLFG